MMVLKNLFEELKKDKTIDEFIEMDNLSDRYQSRIEKLVLCRNEGLNQIKKKLTDHLYFYLWIWTWIYLNLWIIKNLIILLKYFIEGEIDDIIVKFSINQDFDISSLRKKGYLL